VHQELPLRLVQQLFLNDRKTRSELLHTAEIAGQAVDDVSLILGMIVNLKIKPLEQDNMDSYSNVFRVPTLHL